MGSTPFAAPGAQASNATNEFNEKRSIDEMHLVTQKPSQASLASATAMASDSPNPFETDIEAAITHTDSNNANIVNTSTTKASKHTAGSKSIGNACGDAQVWPGQSHWKKKDKERKIQRSRTCLSRLSKRNRLIAKILLGLFVLSIAVGVGLGISKPLGAAIWGQKKNN